MLSARPRDTSKAGFVNWPLMSVATWGENPTGIWTLTVEDMTDEENSGKVGPISLVLHGTTEMPVHMHAGPNWTIQPTTKWMQPEEYEEVDASVLTDVENELQRMNHRNNDAAIIGV
ncbi:Neuroendocrine convertase [Operophtera brumata]|uniref:Neuroendocrine convertase n=1 Tax=Operophtera brumata TaxID=104452 RepID=A0A0L7LCF8_OPEBR|nr:Neuroendocrine convertase [Operophtera brumata]